MLLRLLFVSTLLFVNLFACKGGYSSCVAKVKDSQSIVNGVVSIPLEGDIRVVYSHTKPHALILKYDPFLSLYLIKDKHPFPYPFGFNMWLQLGTAMVTKEGSCEGKILKHQIGLNSFAQYNQKLIVPSVLTSSCCSLEGIVTRGGIIEKEYLYHFIKSKNSLYGDIGIRLKDTNRQAVVEAVDPFMQDNPFKKGDIILQYDNKKIRNPAYLMQKILFSPLFGKHTIVLERNGKRKRVSVKTMKRYGGGFISDTFLESRGLYFDRNLRLNKIEGRFKNYGLHLGDRLIQVNGKLVHNQKELRKYIENFQNYSSLLFERNGFQFFVNIK